MAQRGDVSGASPGTRGPDLRPQVTANRAVIPLSCVGMRSCVDDLVFVLPPRSVALLSRCRQEETTIRRHKSREVSLSDEMVNKLGLTKLHCCRYAGDVQARELADVSGDHRGDDGKVKAALRLPFKTSELPR